MFTGAQHHGLLTGDITFSLREAKCAELSSSPRWRAPDSISPASRNIQPGSCFLTKTKAIKLFFFIPWRWFLTVDKHDVVLRNILQEYHRELDVIWKINSDQYKNNNINQIWRNCSWNNRHWEKCYVIAILCARFTLLFNNIQNMTLKILYIIGLL